MAACVCVLPSFRTTTWRCIALSWLAYLVVVSSFPGISAAERLNLRGLSFFSWKNRLQFKFHWSFMWRVRKFVYLAEPKTMQMTQNCSFLEKAKTIRQQWQPFTCSKQDIVLIPVVVIPKTSCADLPGAPKKCCLFPISVLFSCTCTPLLPPRAHFEYMGPACHRRSDVPEFRWK